MGDKAKVMAHYNRMMRYAVKQKGKIVDFCISDELQRAIGESYGGRWCPLCQKYDCSSCPIQRTIGVHNCRETPWEIMEYEDVWGDWHAFIIALKAMRRFLRNKVKHYSKER